MQTHVVKSILLALILISCSATCLATIIANSNVVQNTISPSELKSIFLGTTSHWNNDTPITLCIDNSDSEKANQFYIGILRKNPRSYQRFWSKKLFSGDAATMPRIHKSPQKALSFAINKEGAICYTSSLPETLPFGIKVIEVSN